ncbi:transposase, partial [Streptomyces sp. NPDC060205]|uniref:transposase n=1 Tax=Streptomyces sp. NPDC060205 TaxID=3347072 RepID=UPI0036576020
MGAATRGFDAGKEINGRKRHLAVDMRGIPLKVMVAPATNRDDGPARDLLFRLRLAHPEVTVAWADSAYGGELVPWARSFLGLTLHSVPRRKGQDRFAVLAKRWRGERTISWIMRARRNVRDYERLISHSEAHLTWTMITLMVRRLVSPPRPPLATLHPVAVRADTASQLPPIRLGTRSDARAVHLAVTALAWATRARAVRRERGMAHPTRRCGLSAQQREVSVSMPAPGLQGAR